MFDTVNKEVYISNQLKTLSNIVFVITFGLIYYNNEYNILPLNIFILVGSIFLFHIYPNYYKIVESLDKRVIPYLMIADIVIHYLPIVYIITKNIQNTTKTNYLLCFNIFIVYIILFYQDIHSIYFEPEKYYKKPPPRGGQDSLVIVQ
jgi:hypothetical protein